jgi:hypothetical protein
MDRDFPLAAHVESISARSHDEASRIARVLVGRSWPGGAGDRTDRAALDWVRQWRPLAGGTANVACGCETGCCTVCN